MPQFDQYMQRCLHLALKGLGNVAPNPMVGCVIVHNDVIIGEGYHQKYGEAHAEVNAIASVADKELLSESTLYVNLEPCAHHGKTPPCSDLLIEHKIKRVVIGCLDTNPLVAGKGIAKLQAAGIEVPINVMEAESRELNKRFFTWHEKKRPYIILKWAQTKDGFISKLPPFTREENWITNNESKKLVHLWRGQEQAIMVGTVTAITDNPSLTVRLSQGKNPIRIVIDRELKIPITNSVFSNEAETIVFTEKKCSDTDHISYHQVDFTKNILPGIMDVLSHKKIISLLVEGGAYMLQSFIDKDLWDEARIFTGDKIFHSGIKAPEIIGGTSNTQVIDSDELKIFTR